MQDSASLRFRRGDPRPNKPLKTSWLLVCLLENVIILLQLQTAENGVCYSRLSKIQGLRMVKNLPICL